MNNSSRFVPSMSKKISSSKQNCILNGTECINKGKSYKHFSGQENIRNGQI